MVALIEVTKTGEQTTEVRPNTPIGNGLTFALPTPTPVVPPSEDTTDEAETDPTTETGDPLCDPTNPEQVEQDYLAKGEGRSGVSLSGCEFHVWWVSAANGSSRVKREPSPIPSLVATICPWCSSTIR